MSEKMISKPHKEFIRLVVDGMTLENAYQQSINKKSTPKSARESGSRLAKKYALEIEQERKNTSAIVEAAKIQSIVKTQEKRILSKIERLELLTQFAEDEMSNVTEKIKAIAELNKMDGAYAPTKVESTINAELSIPRQKWLNDSPQSDI